MLSVYIHKYKSVCICCSSTNYLRVLHAHCVDVLYMFFFLHFCFFYLRPSDATAHVVLFSLWLNSQFFPQRNNSSCCISRRVDLLLLETSFRSQFLYNFLLAYIRARYGARQWLGNFAIKMFNFLRSVSRNDAQRCRCCCCCW